MEKFLDVPPVTAAMITLPNFPLSVGPSRLQRVVDAMVAFGFLPSKDAGFRVSSMTGLSAMP